MLHSYLIVALRNLSRNKLYAGINIVGLAVGFAAAMLIALYVRHETSYDAWLPNSDRTYLFISSTTQPGGGIHNSWETPGDLPAMMKLDLPMIASIARLQRDKLAIRHGEIEAVERTNFWADPDIFSVLQLPALYGDLSTALSRPDSIVITRRMARKYFGKDNPIGETLEFDRKHTLTVTAVLKDFPSNTNLDTEFFSAGQSSYAELHDIDVRRDCETCFFEEVETYIRLKPGATVVSLEAAMPAFLERHKYAAIALAAAQGLRVTTSFVSLRDLHTRPELAAYLKPAADPAILFAVSSIGVLIVLVAGINFINLMTARATRRAVEVGVRKAAGAARRDLIAQFIGEAFIYVLLGTIVAAALVELLLPGLNAFIGAEIIFDWWRQPAMIAVIVGLVFVVALSAGAYPAFVMSSFSPSVVLKDGGLPAAGAFQIRQILVVFQFAILISLVVALFVVSRQTYYAQHEAMRLDLDQALIVDTSDSNYSGGTSCDKSFRDAVDALPGVKASACSRGWMSGNGFVDYKLNVITPNGTEVRTSYLPLDFGFFELYGLKPVAGRFFSREHPGDAVPDTDNDDAAFQSPIVVNQAAVRAFGFSSPIDAVGKAVTVDGGRARNHPSEIIGVVPDVTIDTIHTIISPEIYFVNPSSLNLLHLKLRGHDIPETLGEIDRLWAKLGVPRPLSRMFVNQWVQRYYQDVIRQSELFTAFAAVALFIAGLGLFGLSAFTAERRTKEIGIRKAMGANRFDIMKLLLWQFAKPVLWANLIAWPVAWYFMNRWLHGFAAHVELRLWIFIAATVIALMIALGTVSIHAFRVATARPVTSLRYE